MTFTRPLSLWVGLIRKFLAWVRSPLFDNVPRFRERLLARAVPKENNPSKFCIAETHRIVFLPLEWKVSCHLENITKHNKISLNTINYKKYQNSNRFLLFKYTGGQGGCSGKKSPSL